LTETKELRRINRSIPRATQLRVAKRENQICLECGKSVKDEDIEFDHIIPWSKGGSSDENNIRLLCKLCNRKKGKSYEDKCLVQSITEHVIEPIGIEVAYRFLELLRLSHEYFKKLREYPSASDICYLIGMRKVRNEHEMLAREIQTVNEFFVSDKPAEIKQRDFLALKYRWGFSDRQVHKLEEAANKHRMDAEELLSLEINFIKRLGWNVQLTEKANRKWLSL
ncbi:MAG: endonuclease, partial [Dehalococcoidia bacterium]|nr:endonuclease [Dehalococcoidia bacterium]